jgi:hypothetical protein
MEKITQPKPRGKLVSWRDDHQGLSTAEKTPKVPKPIYNCGAAPGRRTLWASHRWTMDAENLNAVILLRLSHDFEQLGFVWLVKTDNRRTDTTIVLSHEFGI